MPADGPDITKVLFVCPENSTRSPMAEAFAEVYGTGRASVSSAGTNPAGAVHPTAVEVMFELGYNIREHRPRHLSEASGAEYDAVVSIGCAPERKLLAARHWEQWNIPDPGPMPVEGFRAVRDLVEEKVKGLLLKVLS